MVATHSQKSKKITTRNVLAVIPSHVREDIHTHNMSNNDARSTAQPSLIQQYITPKLIKDIKFFLVGVVVMTVTIFHYLWIIKRWMINPNIATVELSGHFVVFAIVQLFIWYLYLFKFTATIYKEELAEYNEAEELRKQDDLNRKQR